MRALLLIDGIAALAWGIGFVVVPALVLALFGIGIDPAGAFLARLLGASLLGYGGLMLLARNGDPRTLVSMTRGQLAFDVVGLLVTAHAAWTGTANALMWGVVAMFAGLVLVRGRLATRSAMS